MDDPRLGAIHETELLLESAQRLRAQLRDSEFVYRQMLRELQQGSTAATTTDTVGVDKARSELTTAIRDFEQQRHRSRVATIALQLAEGETIGAIGRAWGFSRQLASVYANEARQAFGA